MWEYKIVIYTMYSFKLKEIVTGHGKDGECG